MDEILVWRRQVVTLAQARVVAKLPVPLGQGGQDQQEGVEPDGQDGGQVTLPPVEISGHLGAAQTEAPGEDSEAGGLPGLTTREEGGVSPAEGNKAQSHPGSEGIEITQSSEPFTAPVVSIGPASV